MRLFDPGGLWTTVTQFSINYAKEAKCFDTLQLFLSQQDNNYYVWGEVEGTRCFTAKVCL